MVIVLLRVYQASVSPCFPSCCRFYPSCSQYAVEAVARYGVLGGAWRALRRLVRCHPWGGSGYDPLT